MVWRRGSTTDRAFEDFGLRLREKRTAADGGPAVNRFAKGFAGFRV